MDLYVDFDILSVKSKEVDDFLDDLMNKINDGKNLVEKIKINWAGDSYDNFNKKMLGYYEKLNEGMKKMQAYNDYLKSYIKDMNSLEETYESRSISLV